MNKREDDEMSERLRGWKERETTLLLLSAIGHPAELRWISKCLSCAFETQSLSGYTAVTRCVADGGHLARMQGTTTDETVTARSLWECANNFIRLQKLLHARTLFVTDDADGRRSMVRGERGERE